MAPPTPPVALKDHCSVIYNNVLYVYSPDAFLTLSLEPNTQWKKETNGVSVTGATCVKGGIDGDNSRPAMYVVGGSSSSSDYPGLQRYSIVDNSWQTITPVVPVTQNRLHHGTAYMNASSSIVVYAGSQNDYDGPSTETFLIELYPPYRVQAYSSIAPPVKDPIMLQWSDDHALLVGGGSTNQQVFTFGPADGWQDLGLALPAALPDRSVAQSALFTLDDNSKVLETFDMSQSPVLVSRNVLLNPGGLAAAYNETVGSGSTTSRKRKRSTYLSNFPTYNNQYAPTGTRSGFSLAQDDAGLVTIVGGDKADSIVIFNGTGNSWLNADQVVAGTPQATRTTPASTVSSSPPSQTSTTQSPSPIADKGHGLTILGAVLGAICGVAAILIILLLWLRSVRRHRAHATERERRKSEYPADKKRISGELGFEDQSLQPLSKSGQPMGRSPVPSAIVDPEPAAPYSTRQLEKPQEKRLSSALGHRLKLDPHVGNGMGFGQGMFKRERSPLSISKPMAPDLGDYSGRPSIELGRATPVVPPAAVMPARKPSQRKTDEGWAKYFQADGARIANNRSTIASQGSGSTSRGKGGFWPGSGVPEARTRSGKLALRDSSGNALQAQTVAAASPSLEPRARGLEVVQGIPARISSGNSVSSTGSVDHDQIDDDEYEDERIEHAYSSGIPSSIHDNTWTPMGSNWTAPHQRPPRPPSSSVSSAYPSGVYPLPTSISHATSTSHETSNSSGTKRSSIPSFPMPSSTIRPVNNRENLDPSLQSTTIQHPTASHFATTITPLPPPRRPKRPSEDARDYFGATGLGRDGMPINSNLSWLNLNADQTPPEPR